jgi:lipoprotein-anchoring transpeptidase ErfK/SrfK
MALAALLLACAGAQAAQAAPARPIARQQQIVKVFAVKGVFARPVFGGRTIAAVAPQRPLTQVSTKLPVLARTKDADGRSWLRVRLPGRTLTRKAPPTTGWITAADTLLQYTAWHVVVEVDKRRVLVYRDGRRVRTFGVIVGKPSTPTPRGEFFVEETLRLGSKLQGAPAALATSARSNVLQEFEGGPGQIALHGRGNLGGTIGTAVSHGCVRLATPAIIWLAQHIQAGVPLTIR